MNLKRAFIALSALLLGVGIFGVSPATAASLDTVSHGGVTCEQWPTNFGTYPNTYWVCTANHAAPSGAEMIVGQTAKTQLTASMKVLFANVEIMIFQNQADFASFTGATAPATKYVAWAASAGPAGTSLANKRIAAVFATANLYSTTIAPTNVIAARDITAYYKPHIMQAFGRQYDALIADASKKSGAGTPFETLANEYDEFYLNQKTSATVWGATLAGQYPGSNPWQIFGTLYGNSPADLFAFNFMQTGGWSHLATFLQGSPKNVIETLGFMNQQIYQSVPAKPYSYQGIAFCVQYTTTSAAPVDVIWNCVHPYDAQGTETTAGTAVGAMPTAFRNTLIAANATFYTFYDYKGFNDFTTPAPLVPQVGTLGATWQPTHRSGAFSISYTTADIPGTPGTFFASDGYYRGTLVHEASHQLDLAWAGYAPGETRYSRGTAPGSWGSVVAADVVQFNALTCMAAINNNDLCTNPLYAGRTNYERFLTGMGLYGKPVKDQNEEIFCYMMQKKSGQPTVSFLQYVENKFWALGTPNMKNSIDTTWATGHP